VLNETSLTASLQSIPWFLELKPAQMERLAQIAHIVHLQMGECLFVEGEQIDMLYLVLNGRVIIESYVPTRGQLEIFSAELLDIIGWSSLTPVVRQRAFSARAVQAAALIGFDGPALRQLCEQDHDIGYIVMRRIANVIASRLLVTRLHLVNMIANPGQEKNRAE
jgi:CRP-like cAMP-binding protein